MVKTAFPSGIFPLLIQMKAALALLSVAYAQEQAHLSLTGSPTTMALDFVVANTAATGIKVTYGQASSATVDCQTQTLNTYKAQWCTALMTGLHANTLYSYTISSSDKTFTSNFTNQPTSRPPVFAIYADFGVANDESLAALIADSNNGGFDYVIHAGDWAYDLDDSGSQTGNKFMEMMTPYSSRRPYMGVPGNHEAYGTQGGGAFAQFTLRNRAVAQYAGAASGSNSNYWYSFETPLIHWIGFCGESWTMSAGQLATQQAWVERDLANVDRSITPWVIAFSHKSFQMDSTTWSMYDFLPAGKVDLWFVGHWHQYTRYPPIDSRNGTMKVDMSSVSADKSVYTNPLYPVLVVTGAPGNGEVNPRTCTEENQIYCSGNYGYGKAQALNATHLHWQWNTTVPVAGSPNPSFSDDLWIVKSQ